MHYLSCMFHSSWKWMKYHDLARSQTYRFPVNEDIKCTTWTLAPNVRLESKIRFIIYGSPRFLCREVQHWLSPACRIQYLVSFGKTAQQDQKCNQETFYTLFCKEKRMMWSPKVWYGASCSQFWIYYNIHFCLREHTCEQIPTKTLYTSQPSNRVQ